MIRVSAIVLAYGDEPWTERCVGSLLASAGVDVEVVVVDNGDTTGAVSRLEGTEGVRVVRAGRNLGFAGGCNVGVAASSGDIVALVNADAEVDADALAELARVASRPSVGVATASIRLADEPERLNSAGNPITYVGLSWAGGFGEAASRYARERPVPGASGAGLAIRRELWDALGGFEPAYFAYHEDVELSWRCWQRGYEVVYVPSAIVHHRYEFSRNPLKYELVERNRLLFVLTAFEARTLVLVAPVLLVVEVGMLAVSVGQGWWRQKLAGWRWLVRNRDHVRRRRARLQSERTVSDRDLAGLLSARFAPPNVDLPPGAGLLDLLLSAWWALVRPAL